jgi:hypothetical protein
MTKDLLKQIIAQLKLTVDEVVSRSTNTWDDLLWRTLSQTVLSDGVLDLVLDKLGFRGVAVSGLLDRDQLRAVLNAVVAAIDSVTTLTPTPWDNLVWRGLRATVLSDAVLDSLFSRLQVQGIAG